MGRMSRKEDHKKTQKKLEKAEKNMTKHKSNEDKKPVMISIILLLLMVSSLVAFAFLDTGTTPGGNSDSGYTNLPFGQYPTQQGEVWAAVINEEQFIFQDLEFLEGRDHVIPTANNIKQSTQLQVYLEQDFANADGAFLLEQKVSSAFSIPVSRVQNLIQCTEQTIVFTYNGTQEQYSGCSIMESIQGEEYLDAQALSYYLVNDFQG
jgi:hypothetical protein